MTARCALAMALLEGRVLNVKNCFETIGLTNIAREIPRMIEDVFHVEVSRTPMTGKSRYQQPVTWTNYRLNFTDYNKTGIEKMKSYCREQLLKDPPRTNKEVKQFRQQNMFLS